GLVLAEGRAGLGRHVACAQTCDCPGGQQDGRADKATLRQASCTHERSPSEDGVPRDRRCPVMLANPAPPRRARRSTGSRLEPPVLAAGCSSRWAQVEGGKTPFSMRSARSATRAASLMWSTETVTRPIAVRPWRTGPSQRKCRPHLSRRGLKSGVSLCVRGSNPARSEPLNELHQ